MGLPATKENMSFFAPDCAPQTSWNKTTFQKSMGIRKQQLVLVVRGRVEYGLYIVCLCEHVLEKNEHVIMIPVVKYWNSPLSKAISYIGETWHCNFQRNWGCFTSCFFWSKLSKKPLRRSCFTLFVAEFHLNSQGEKFLRNSLRSVFFLNHQQYWVKCECPQFYTSL